MNKTTLRIALIAFGAFVVWAIAAANLGWSHPFYYFVEILPYGDKVGHFILMGTLSLLANLVLGARTISVAGRPVLLGSLVVLLLVTLEELSQGFIPSRTLSATDLTADFLGIWLFGRIAAFIIKRQTIA